MMAYQKSRVKDVCNKPHIHRSLCDRGMTILTKN